MTTKSASDKAAAEQGKADTDAEQTKTAELAAAGADGADADTGVEDNPPADKLHVTMTRAQKVKAGVCVVPDGESATPHVGRAVNGLVCSAHAMHYDAQGNRRGGAPAAEETSKS